MLWWIGYETDLRAVRCFLATRKDFSGTRPTIVERRRLLTKRIWSGCATRSDKLHINIDFFSPAPTAPNTPAPSTTLQTPLKSYGDRDDLSDWVNVNVNVHEKNIVKVHGRRFQKWRVLDVAVCRHKKNNDMGRTIQLADDVYAAARISVGSEKFGLNLNEGL